MSEEAGEGGTRGGVGHATATGRIAIWRLIYHKLGVFLGCGILLHPYVRANVVKYISDARGRAFEAPLQFIRRRLNHCLDEQARMAQRPSYPALNMLYHVPPPTERNWLSEKSS